ncbi:hypothetical protein F5148DRAFT_263352 [Russula earlei]|uniref:Uncharacterized protein n=1 Tax=Russula earlei TaxID=71964 RepID=A0ACC0UIX7_9AGAM|nr:hypothetical protein F5148DRAFT_263352 [Russula earlei]
MHTVFGACHSWVCAPLALCPSYALFERGAPSFRPRPRYRGRWYWDFHHKLFSPTSMASTTASATFQSILNAAFDGYANQTGIDLTNHPTADKLQHCHSPEDILHLLLERETAFKDYRDKHRKLIDTLRPIVQVIHAFSGILGEAACLVPFQPTKAIFVTVDILLSAAINVTASYDALSDLFDCVSNFLNRLNIYTEKVPLSPMMSNIVVRIMVEVLSVFALATKQINQGRFSK